MTGGVPDGGGPLPRTGGPRRAWLPWLSLTIAITAFVADVWWRPAILAELLYLFPPLLAFLPAAQQRRPLLVGAKVTALSLVAVVLRGDFAWVVLADRAVGLAAVWITVAVCLVHHRDRRAIVAERAIGQSYLDIADVLIAVLDLEGKVILVNPRGCQLLGREQDALVGSHGIDSLFAAESREAGRQVLAALACAPSRAVTSRARSSERTGALGSSTGTGPRPATNEGWRCT